MLGFFVVFFFLRKKDLVLSNGFFKLQDLGEDYGITIGKPDRPKISYLSTGDACEACGLHAKVRHPKLGITGRGNLNILYLGEAQGAKEDELGKQFVGDAGQVLRNTLASIGIDFERDLFCLNACRCRPTSISDKGNIVNRTPDDNEIAWCWKGTWDLIKELKPKAIWLAGLVPLQSYLLDKGQEKPTMAKWRGWAIPDQDLGCWIIPHYHPSFVHRNPNDRGLANLFRRDLESALEKSQKPFPVYTPMNHIEILQEDNKIIDLLDSVVLNPDQIELLAFDFETTSLKPHALGHDIKYAAICFDPGFLPVTSWAFPTNNRTVRHLLNQIIAHPDIPIAAHNIQFEDLWSKVILKVQPQNWAWDSQVAAHVLDDRSGITSLEFQAAVRYGDWTFKDETDPYLRPPSMIDGRKTGNNDFNRIMDCPKDKILLRVAKDALYGYWLAMDQMKEIQEMPKPMQRGDSVLDMYWLFHDGTLALGDTSVDGGLVFDEVYFTDQRKTIIADVAELEKTILTLPPSLLWKEKTGKEINPGSDKQLRTLLFKYYGIKANSWTDKDQESIGKSVLENYYDHPQLGDFCQLTIDFNKKRKLVSTNIDGFARESVNGVIYPGFSLSLARSGRSASKNPNFQNIPIRDEWSKQTIRMGLYPHPGHHFVGADYSAHEWKVAACYSNDPIMLDYIIHDGDPHRDQAIELFLLRPDQVTEKLRYEAKSNFIFAELYGSWWKACADNIWTAIAGLKTADGIPIYQHLRSKGIRGQGDFLNHVKAVEKKFWRKFNVLDSWRREWLERYERDGVVPMFHGFQRQGHLSRNQIWNTSIQGTAFHLLLESYIELNRIRKEEKWESKILGQIHDSIVMSVHPGEKDYIFELTNWVMTEWIKQKHNWIIVPLEAEFSCTKNIDEPWAMEKKVKREIAII
jgi:uracil-DNA glycosylase family 4